MKFLIRLNCALVGVLAIVAAIVGAETWWHSEFENHPTCQIADVK